MIHNAIYAPAQSNIYKNNPLIECIPIIESEVDFYNAIKTTPELPVGLWDYDNFSAMDYFSELEVAYLPHPSAWTLYLHFIQQIKSGYRSKNPLDKSGQCFINTVITRGNFEQKYAIPKRNKAHAGKAKCSFAKGISGVGKSEVINTVLSCIPQVIRHVEYNSTPLIMDQLVWVSIDVSASNSLKGLALNFFTALDEQLGTSYAYNNRALRNPVDFYIGAIRELCAKHMIGFVHIDECQHLLKSIKSGESATLEHLESLFNRIGIPMLMTSTPEGAKLFFNDNDEGSSPRVQNVRRLMSERVYEFEPIDINSKFYHTFFDLFLPKYLFTDSEVQKNEFRHRVHYLTFGIHAIIARLLRLFFEAAHKLNLTPENVNTGEYFSLLDKVYLQHFEAISLSIAQLRQNKAQEYEYMIQQSSDKKPKKLNTSRAMHSSVRGAKMASERSKAKLNSCNAEVHKNELQAGLSEHHQ